MATASCPECGEPVPSQAGFCPSCGHALDDGSASRESSSESGVSARNLTAVTHLLALFTWILGPLIVLLVSDDEFVIRNAKNALAWQLMFLVYAIISMILLVILVGALLLVVVGLLDTIFCIIAAVKAAEGEAWEYPLTPTI